MKEYDVVFMHPPRNFKEPLHKRLFKKNVTGPQGCQLPMGVFSLADILNKKGYNVKIINLGIEQEINPFFSLERYIKSINAKIFAIDLHWTIHSGSVIKLSEICKRYHPNSLILLGGNTATWFHDHILKEYPFIDVILRGEAEFSLPQLVDAFFKDQEFNNVDGITYRHEKRIRQTPIGKLLSNLDNLNTIRFDLLNNYEKYFQAHTFSCGNEENKLFWLPISRGCPHNCAYCGGGSYSYRLLTGRDNVIMRSPKKIAKDLEILQEKKIERVCFSHDPSIGGRKYYLDLFKEVKNRDLDITAYTEIFRLPTKEFVEKYAETFHNPFIAISPESFSEEVRKLIGRKFSNHDLYKSLIILKEKNVKASIWFTIGLPGEVAGPEWVESFNTFSKKVIDLGGLIVPPEIYTIDPNCLLAVKPNSYGIKLILKTLEDYANIFSSSNVLKWVGHETQTFSREEIANFTAYANYYIRKITNDYTL